MHQKKKIISEKMHHRKYNNGVASILRKVKQEREQHPYRSSLRAKLSRQSSADENVFVGWWRCRPLTFGFAMVIACDDKDLPPLVALPSALLPNLQRSNIVFAQGRVSVIKGDISAHISSYPYEQLPHLQIRNDDDDEYCGVWLDESTPLHASRQLRCASHLLRFATRFALPIDTLIGTNITTSKPLETLLQVRERERERENTHTKKIRYSLKQSFFLFKVEWV